MSIMRFTVLFLFGVFSCVVAVAQEEKKFSKSARISVGAAHESNPLQIPNSEDKDTRLFTSVDFSLGKSAKHYQLSMGYEADYGDYLEKTLEEDYGITGSSALTIGHKDSPVKWRISNTQQDTLLRTTAPNVPSNSVSRSTFSTGPTLQAKISSVDTLSYEWTFNKFNVDAGAVDSERISSSASWDHLHSKLTSSRLSVEHSKIRPSFSAIDDYDQQRINYALKRSLKNGSIEAVIGASQLSIEGLDDDINKEFSINFDKSWYQHSIQLSGERQITNNSEGQDLEFFLNFEDIGGQDFSITEQDIFNLNYAWINFFGPNTLSYSLTMTRSNSLESAQIDKIRYNQLSLNRNIFPVTSASLGASHTRYFERDILGNEVYRDEIGISVSVDFNFSETFGTQCSCQRQKNTGGYGEFYETFFSCSASATLF